MDRLLLVLVLVLYVLLMMVLRSKWKPFYRVIIDPLIKSAYCL